MVAVAATISAGTHVAGTAPAGSYAQDTLHCGPDSYQPWRFNDFGTEAFTATERNYVEDSLALLNLIEDHDGTPALNVQQRLDTETFYPAFEKDDLDPLVGGFVHECFDIIINDGINGGQFWWNTTRHEMMHKVGAEHAGQRDSLETTQSALMASCISLSSRPNANILDRDTRAQVMWLHSSPSNRQLHSNWGFEQSFLDWSRTGTGSVTHWTSGGIDNTDYVRWDSTSLNHYVYQATRVLNGDDNEKYGVIANARSMTTGFKTIVNARLYYAEVNLPWNPGASNGCAYADNIDDPNGVPSVGNWMMLSETGISYIHTAWAELSSGALDDNPDAYEAYDFEVRFYGISYDPNDPADIRPVGIDEVRGEGT